LPKAQERADVNSHSSFGRAGRSIAFGAAFAAAALVAPVAASAQNISLIRDTESEMVLRS